MDGIPKCFRKTLQILVFYASPNDGEFSIPSSMCSLKTSYAIFSMACDGNNGRWSVFAQVLAFGRTSSQNVICGCGLKPRGGTSSLPVTKLNTSPKVALHRTAGMEII